MNDYTSKSVCLIDDGLSSYWPERLAKIFGRVFYCPRWKNAFPSELQKRIGEDLIDVQRVLDPFDVKNDTDLFLFLDVYDAPLQKELKEQGKLVWGSQHGENMELYREEAKTLFKELGLPVGPWEQVIGTQELRKFLKENPEWFVKLSITRGDAESWGHKNYHLKYESHIVALEHRLGPAAEDEEFCVEAPIPKATELGYDGWNIDGQFPKTNQMFGWEVKDCGYAGAIVPYSELPDPVKFVNEKLQPAFKQFGYRGFFSSEIRVGKDEKPYLIDFTARNPSPPGEVYPEMYDNWGDIFMAGAQGEIVEPHAVAKYAVQAIIESSYAEKEWLLVDYPKKIEHAVFLRNMCRVKGIPYVIPQDYELCEVGSVVAVGNTLIEAIKKVKEYADQVDGDQVKIHIDAVAKAMKEITDAEEEHGFSFGDKPVPSVEQVAKVAA